MIIPLILNNQVKSIQVKKISSNSNFPHDLLLKFGSCFRKVPRNLYLPDILCSGHLSVVDTTF